LAFFDVQNVANCVVNRGGVVVKVWLETTTIRPAKNMPTFSTFFRFFFQGPTRNRRSTIHRAAEPSESSGPGFAPLEANGADALQLEGDAAADAFGLVCQEWCRAELCELKGLNGKWQ
jgi:hypothetical protein